MTEQKYLPIGTVCRLKDGKKNLMIMGFCQSSVEEQEKTFDYAGCMYPEGIISSEINFLFNHDQIEEILFKGFVNDEETKFKTRLNEFLTTGTIDGQIINFDENGNILNSDRDISYQNMISASDENLQINQQDNVLKQVNNSIQQPTFNTLNLNQQDNNQ